MPKEYGGGGLSFESYYPCLEEIARASVSMAVTVGVTNLVQGALINYGTSVQKTDYLPRLVKGEWIGAFSLSEPSSGSDAASLRCSAKKVPGGYRVNGTKCWCSTAGNADLYLLMARTGEHKTKGITSFLVHKDTPGFRVGKLEKKLGLRASSLAELIFEDCFIPDSERVGAEGEGLKIALSQLDSGRITIGTVGVGIAIEAIVRAWRFLKEKDGEGRPFAEATQQALGEHYAATQAVRTLVSEAGRLKTKGERITVLAAQAKLLGSDLAMRVSSDACHWMMEWGVMREYEVERLMRDAKALQIVEGTNQIQKVLLAREIGEMLA